MQYSYKEFADYLRGNQPEAVRPGETAKTSVERWLASNPRDRSLLKESGVPDGPHPGGSADDGGLLASAAITGARIVPMLIGSGIGGVLGGGATGGPGAIPGAMAGGAAGGAIGESIAQFLERSTGRREEYSPKAMGVEAGLGAIPMTKLLKGGRAIKVAGEAIKGAGIGAGAAASLQWAENKPFDPKGIAMSGAVGGVLGGIGGRIATRRRKGVVPGDQLASEFAPDGYRLNVHNKRMDYDDGVVSSIDSPLPDVLDPATGRVIKKGVPVESSNLDKMRARMYDYLAEGRSFLERLARYGGFERGSIEHGKIIDAGKYSDQIRGGVGNLSADAQEKLNALQSKVQIASGNNPVRGNMVSDLTYYLDMKGFVHAGTIFNKHVQDYTDELIKLKKLGKKGSKRFKKVEKLREDLLAKFEGGKALPGGYTPDKAEAAIVKMRKDMTEKWGPEPAKDYFGEMDSYAEQIFDFNRETLDIMREGGFVDDRLYKFLTEGKNSHIPLNRYIGAMSDSWGSRLKTPLHKLEGSEKTTLEPFAASMLRRRAALLAGAHNGGKAAFINVRNVHPDFEKMIVRVKDGTTAPDGFSNINVFMKGEEQHFQMPTGVAVALESLDQSATNVLGEIGVSFFTRMTQRMATSLNLGFSFTNVLRDVSDVALLRQVVDNPREFGAFAMDWASAAAQLGVRELQQAMRPMIRSKPIARMLGAKRAKSLMDLRDVKFRKTGVTRDQFVRENAGYSTQQRHLDPGKVMPGEYKQSIGDRVGDTVLAPIDFLLGPVARTSNVLEEATKLASFNTLTRKGITGLERTIKTRRFGGSPDFALRGTWAKDAGNFILFFNAQMQGIVRNARGVGDLLTGKDLSTSKGRIGIATILLPLTALELARQTWNAQFTDPDGTKSIDRITDSDHENYHTWILNDLEEVQGVVRHKSIKFSKGHMGRVLFNPIQDIFRAIATPSEKPFSPTQTVLDLSEQFLPGSMKLETVNTKEKFIEGMVSSLAPLWKTPVELLSNKDYFSGIPIKSQYNLGLDPSQQMTSRTSPALSKATRQLAEDTGFEISPLDIQKTVRNILPGGGEQLVEAADILMEGGNIAQAVGGGIIQPIGRRFVGSKGDQKQRDALNRFYSQLARSKRADATLRELSVNNPSEVQKYINRNARLLEQRKVLLKIQNKISDIRKRVPDELAGIYINQILEASTQILDRK